MYIYIYICICICVNIHAVPIVPARSAAPIVPALTHAVPIVPAPSPCCAYRARWV